MSSMMNTDNDNVCAETSPSAISWPAIFGGAFAAAAVSLILLMLGSALGLSTLSPWSQPETVTSVTAKIAIWLIVMQWISSGIGGYLTGRLRTKWSNVHSEEVFFRDTAHGFLAWCAATLLTASLLASAATSIISGGVHATTAIAAGEAAGPRPAAGPHPDLMTGYYIDSLFRSNAPTTTDTKDVRAETTQILLVDLKNGTVPDSDKAYLAHLVSAHTGLNNADATARVDSTIDELNAAKEKLKQDAEAARKTAMHTSLYMFLSLLVGAFIASSAAALGGRHRDGYPS